MCRIDRLSEMPECLCEMKILCILKHPENPVPILLRFSDNEPCSPPDRSDTTRRSAFPAAGAA
jgi:hypothetical protein